MEIILHRANRIGDLEGKDPRFGLEFDIRSQGGSLILNHEPHGGGEALGDYLKAVRDRRFQGVLVFNPKEDGLEDAILEAARSCGARRFFILDLPMPTLVRLAVKERVADLAVRVSEYEPLDAARKLKGLVRWAWLDCFRGDPPDEALVRSLRSDFQVCLVSPELQGYPAESITRFRHFEELVDAVCTDHPERWD